MTEYRIEMVRSPDITDAERRRRMTRAYDLILSFAKQSTERKGVDNDTLGDDVPEAGVPEVAA